MKIRPILAFVAAALLCAPPVLADDILIFGATGQIGSKIVAEALARGHHVTGVSRSPEQFSYTEKNFTGVEGDPTDLASVKDLVKGVDAVINAVGGRSATVPEETPMNLSAIALTTALATLGDAGPQVVVIGGGSTMRGSKEKMLANLPDGVTEGTPMYALFMGHLAAYETYAASNINWTFIAPPMNIKGFRAGPDVRTGKYRASTEDYVRDEDGNNAVSMSDLAVAAVDFAETGKFNRVRVAIGD